MTHKTITVKVPDTIPDPEFSIMARRKGTLDEWEDVEYEEVGTCKWRDYGIHYTPECHAYNLIKQELRKTAYVYCPFCSKKIERI